DLVEGDGPFKHGHHLSRRGVDPFPQVALGEPMARVAHRLIDRARLTDALIPTQFLDDLVWCREPGCQGTQYHQDSGVEGVDRVRRLSFWVALDEVTPDMGAMRFVTGSHREGPLGWPQRDESGETADVLDTYPKLLDLLELSPPFHYQPGDA